MLSAIDSAVSFSSTEQDSFKEPASFSIVLVSFSLLSVGLISLSDSSFSPTNFVSWTIGSLTLGLESSVKTVVSLIDSPTSAGALSALFISSTSSTIVWVSAEPLLAAAVSLDSVIRLLSSTLSDFSSFKDRVTVSSIFSTFSLLLDGWSISLLKFSSSILEMLFVVVSPVTTWSAITLGGTSFEIGGDSFTCNGSWHFLVSSSACMLAAGGSLWALLGGTTGFMTGFGGGGGGWATTSAGVTLTGGSTLEYLWPPSVMFSTGCCCWCCSCCCWCCCSGIWAIGTYCVTGPW